MSHQKVRLFDRRSSRMTRARTSKRGTPGTRASRGGGTLIVSAFEHGKALRLPEDPSVASATQEAEKLGTGGFVVLGYDLPTEDQIKDLAREWDLHPLLLEDLLHKEQRSKVETYEDGVLFVVVRSVAYVDEAEEVVLGEFHIVRKRNMVAILCQERPAGQPWHGHDFTHDTSLLELGPAAVVYSALDSIVDGYAPVMRGLDVDIEQIERQVFSGDPAVARRIYRLSREVVDFQHASAGLANVLKTLHEGARRYGIDDSELHSYLQDVEDHMGRVVEHVSEMRESLNQILNVNSTLVTERQNDDMKKISSWAAIIFAPQLVGSIYGMNFERMPELHWFFGYPMALLMMLGVAVTLYLIFRSRHWL